MMAISCTRTCHPPRSLVGHARRRGILGVGNRVPNMTMAGVARELAMRLVHVSFPPDAVHTPGVGHIIADRLFRAFSPTAEPCELRFLHPALLHAAEDEAPLRLEHWYRTS